MLESRTMYPSAIRQAIREIRTVDQGDILVQIPKTFWGQQVEIIILPLSPPERHPSPKKSLQGCLHEYADPKLIGTEQDAWQEAVREKHAAR